MVMFCKIMQKIARHLMYTNGLQDSFYVANMSALKKKIDDWKRDLPTVRPFYAMKCNPDEVVMREMLKNGFGFDAASKGEISKAISVGANPERDIIFAHPVKKVGEIDYALKKGVRMTTFDSVSEVEKLGVFGKGMGALLRLSVDNASARIQLGLKYGVGWSEYKKVIDEASGSGIDIAGVSFHVGSASKDPYVFKKALALSKEVIGYGRRSGYDMRILDIGGGFTTDGFDDCAKVINKELEAFKGMQVIAEPGRYFVEDVFTFFTPIIGQRERGEKREYWIGDGLYGSMNCVIYDSQVPVFKYVRSKRNGCVDEEREYPSIIHGQTCDSRDTLDGVVMLPSLDNGDFLMIENFGAYTLAGACDFNGINMTTPKIFYVEGHEVI